MVIACKFYRGSPSILAACDRELLGKKLKFGEVDFEIRESFYFERFITLEEFSALMKEAEVMNLVGERVVGCCILGGLVNRNSVKLIDGVPHIQIYKI